MKRMKRKEGYTLIELLLSLSLIALILVSVFFVYNKTTTDMKTNEMIKELNNISSQAINLSFGNNMNQGGDPYKTSFPHEMIDTSLIALETPSYHSWNGRLYKSPFGGEVSTWVYNLGSPAIFSSYNITINSINDDGACFKIANSQINRELTNNISINGNLVFSVNNKTGKIEQKESEIKDNILKHCKIDGNNKSLSISITYK